MKFIDWFAGIGGVRRGMELAGHECVGFCEFDKFASASYRSMHTITKQQRDYLEKMDLRHRQKEILKEEYLNGEWFAEDIRTVKSEEIPESDCWCFGFPCQDISCAGKAEGIDGKRSSLFFGVTGLIRRLPEEKRPTYLFIENVKNLLSVNRGWDFTRVLIELDEIGYDAEWTVLNTKDFGIPQNRERCFIIAVFRGRCSGPVLPAASDIIKVNEPGITAIQNQIGVICGYKHTPKLTDVSSTICAAQGKGTCNQPMTFVCVPCLTPDRIKKRQNGRRFKEDGDPMFTLTSIDRHGVAVSDLKHPHVWYDKYSTYVSIRRLTPKECFRLQGWTDEYFDRARFVNSDSQLYKQAGNAVTVQVVYEIAKRMEI